MGWVIALAVIVLLAWLPLGVGGKYDASGAAAWLLAGPISIPIYPKKKKKKHLLTYQMMVLNTEDI